MILKDSYIKLFCLILFSVAVLQIYFFIDYHYSIKEEQRPKGDLTKIVRILMLKELIEVKIPFSNGFLQAGETLEKTISDAAVLYDAKVWVEDADGRMLLASFPPEKRPVIREAEVARSSRQHGVNFYRLYVDEMRMSYVETPLDSEAGEPLSLHILDGSLHINHDSKFTFGIAGIILVMLVITVSLMQFIRIKVNRLRKSVLRIAGGDLAHRVAVDGRGVVEELGLAFNSMADSLEEMIIRNKEITANVSHEIRAPLARIHVLEDLLRKKYRRSDFSDYERHLDNIRDDVQILDDLLGRLLEFIKLDNFEIKHDGLRFNPSELLNDLLIRFEPVVELKQLQIEKDLQADLSLQGNLDAITSAFLNVIDNAHKYIAEKGVIRIKTYSDKGFFHADIVNSYKKIDQAVLDVVFTPFGRSQRSKNAGSGLGLAISKKIIEKHGGEITALNSEVGFKIKITLPLV